MAALSFSERMCPCSPWSISRESGKQGDFTQTDFTKDIKGGSLLGERPLGWSRSQTVLRAELLAGDHDRGPLLYHGLPLARPEVPQPGSA